MTEVTATLDAAREGLHTLHHARSFAAPLLAGELLDTGENALSHADAVASIVATIGGASTLQAAAYLVYACQHLNRPRDVIAKAFGDNLADLALATTQLVRVQSQAREAGVSTVKGNETAAVQTENVRKMLLAFSKDLRVILLRLASRLQTLRHFAATKLPVPPSLAKESLDVFAALANRLGIWQIKWEMEDLSFRFLEPQTYREVARKLDAKRGEREAAVESLRTGLETALTALGIRAAVQGRPKHIYSIVKKMRQKSLAFEQVFDVQALRVVVPEPADCYGVLAHVHTAFAPIAQEFDDYIARPKSNGYQSLHTVVRDAEGQAVEIQIRTQAMHDHAEHGVAAHWAYKEAGTKGYAGVSATGDYDNKIAVLRQLLAWERDLTETSPAKGLFEDRIYVLTPEASVIELPQGATAVDFAYTVHTSLGHRCRGARVDGVMVPLNTPLKNGQSVEIMAVKDSGAQVGPSRDWLNPELGYMASHRAKAKVRAWFNAQIAHETIARGREAVEKLLQREGKTALRLEDLADQLGFKSADALFEVVGKDEFSLRSIENVLRPPEPVLTQDNYLLLKKPRPPDSNAKGGVLVVGVDSLLTQLAKCCKPVPPDSIQGFVTRGKGVSIHRADCSNLRELIARNGERVIEVAWGQPKAVQGASGAASQVYPVDVAVEAADRQGLLRDISEVFAKEKMNVIGVQTQSVKHTAWMTFTVEVTDSGRLGRALGLVGEVAGVRGARRR